MGRLHPAQGISPQLYTPKIAYLQNPQSSLEVSLYPLSGDFVYWCRLLFFRVEDPNLTGNLWR